MDNANSSFNGYTITKPLNSYLSFSFYKALSPNKVPVILKCAKKTKSSSEAHDIFIHELAIAKSIPSPSIVKILSMEETPGSLFLVLEDHESIKINDYLGMGKKTYREILPILIGIIKAFSDIHNVQIIHNSIQPANIIINEKTGRIKIANFDRASRVPYMVNKFSIQSVEKEIAYYMSPEQTGMMNRSVDYRTDYYSLGVVFYEILSGRLPFEESEVLALIHAHVYEDPENLHDIDPDIPLTLSDIVRKLMAKKAEDRYQSCHGILNDLEHCLAVTSKYDKTGTFFLGEKDIGTRFNVPEKLYGRDLDLDILSQSFEKANALSERPILIFVSGGPGIGKSSLIREFRNSLIEKSGLFISGKFDQWRRSAPYSAIISAFRNLVDLLVSDIEILPQTWASKIKELVKVNAGIITDVVPCLERIIGHVSAPHSLSPSENEIRFSYAFQTFMALFAGEHRPLVLALEDLQWADKSSIIWLANMLKNPELSNFIFIGSYRENDIAEDHPLRQMLAEIGDLRFEQINIRLGPLSLDDIDELLSETLHTSREETIVLAKMVINQTSGNPFFVNEFVKSLSSGKLYGSLVTDNVVEFVSGKILSLPASTQELLRVAACAGLFIFFDTLSLVCNKNTDELITILKPAIEEGLVIKLDTGAMFGHDRVREAIYRMLEENEKTDNHYRLGKALLDITGKDQIEDRIFPIVHQLNIARKIIRDENERIRLAELNLLAGLKSKNSTAYQPALNFFHIARSLLPQDAWTTIPDLTLTLAMETCEVEYLVGDLDAANACVKQVLDNATDYLDRVRVYKAQVPLNTIIGRTNDAFELGRKACALLKVKLPGKITQIHVMIELVKALILLRKNKIESFKNLPEIVEMRSIAISELLMNLTLPAYISFPDAVPYLMIRMFSFSVLRGNSSYSAYAYAGFALILACVLGDFDAGYNLGKFAFELGKKIDTSLVQCKVNFIFGNLIRHWKKPLREDIKILDQGALLGFETGDLTFASFCINHSLAHSIFCGENLDSAKQKGERLLKMLNRFKQIDSIHAFYLFYQCVLNLGICDSKICFTVDGEYFLEKSIIGEWTDSRNQTDLGFYTVMKLFIAYLGGDYESCIEHSENGKKYLGNMLGMPYVKEFHYYSTLAMLAFYPEAPISARKKCLSQSKKTLGRFKKWASVCPENCLHKYYFIEAEILALSDESKKAIESYDKALEASNKNGFVNEEAIISERVSNYCYRNGMSAAGEKYLRRAFESYGLWGLKSKCLELSEKHPELSLLTK